MGLLQDPFFSFLSPPLLFSVTFSLFALLSTVQAVVGSTVRPSNNSADLLWTEQARYLLQSTQVLLPDALDLAPLTRTLVDVKGSQLKRFDITGSLVTVDASNSLLLQSSDIAFITCDQSAYPGNLDASQTVSNVITSQQKPVAVILYSTIASHCNYTNDGTSNYANLFTLLSAGVARDLAKNITSTAPTGTSEISPDMSTFPLTTSPGDGDSGNGGGATDSPNTAMIILYSITGIITALFLTIIITGAIRAHRHPERYGPRQRPGRPRQSRARGIARAMLETIPIVKFGDHDDRRPDTDKGDVEMSMASEVLASQETEPHQPPMATGGTTVTPSPTEAERQPPTTTTTTTGTTPEPNQGQRSPLNETETSTDHPNFSCPICTDDFVKGQDLRVLPCNHQFHPECIDPWLVNVSGTCPLCRIDLNPAQPEGENEGEGGETAAAEAAQPERQTEVTSRHHRRFSSYLRGTLDARRMRDASVEERLAALRSVRENSNHDGNTTEETDEQRRRHRRVSERLRERFRIRTRPHGDDELREETTSP